MGRVVVDANIVSDPGATTPDNAANELVITFDVLIDNPDVEATFENQADLTWNGMVATSDDPTVVGPNDPAVVSIGTLSATGDAATIGLAAGGAVSLAAIAATIVNRNAVLYRK